MDKESAFKKWIGEFHYEEDVQDAFFNGFELGQSCAFEWQPIETAPKDETEIILRRGSRVSSGSWLEWSIKESAYDNNGTYYGEVKVGHCAEWGSWDGGFTEEEPPTHWMPLPSPPEETEESK